MNVESVLICFCGFNKGYIVKTLQIPNFNCSYVE